MSTDRVYMYLLKLVLLKESCDICYAKCGCLAGTGHQGNCKHITSLAYALVDFCKLQNLPDYMMCTDLLQMCTDLVMCTDLLLQISRTSPVGSPYPQYPLKCWNLVGKSCFLQRNAPMVQTMFDPHPLNRQPPDPNAFEGITV